MYQLNSSSVCLISGGAKGIAAQAAIKLAQHHQSTFLLLGRSSLTETEPIWAQNCSNEVELKKRILEHLLNQGKKPIPIQVQKEYKNLASRREILHTLKAIEEAGGKGEYISVDVTDLNALQNKLLPRIKALGGVNTIIHAAGNLADKTIEKKTAQDFETVYAAKVMGLENLLQCVNLSQLNHLVLFSSVVGFYGNAGQTDYALANDILNKSAHQIQQKYPNCHVVAINWGPWDSGMVSPEVKKAFAERNIETLSVEEGTQMLLNELADENRDTSQVIIGSPLTVHPFPLKANAPIFRISRHLTLAANPFLNDHVIAGRPVLPATCAIAWIANVCEQLYPGYKFFSCQKFKVLKGIVFDQDSPEDYILELQEIDRDEPESVEISAKIWSKNKLNKIRYHFSETLKLQRKNSPTPMYSSLNLRQDNLVPADNIFYRNGGATLFHGLSFQGVQNVINISPEKLTTECFWSEIPLEQQGQFPLQTFNPYIFDIQIHSLWIWMQYFHRKACLPAEIISLEHFAPIPSGEKFYVSCEILSKRENIATTNIIAHTKAGKIYSRILGAKGTIPPIQIT